MKKSSVARKIIAFSMILALCLSLSVTAFAAQINTVSSENVLQPSSAQSTVSGSASLYANSSQTVTFHVYGDYSAVAHAKIIVSGIPAGGYALTLQVRRSQPNGQSINEAGVFLFTYDQTLNQTFYNAYGGDYQFTVTPGPTNGFWYTIIVDIENGAS